MKYFCSCCDKEFEKDSTFFAVRDGKRLVYLHEECILVFSGGVEVDDIEERCGAILENIVRYGAGISFMKPGTFDIHRTDGPAIEFDSGDKWWYVDNKRHREDGPAFEYNGGKQWYLNGEYYTEEEHKAEMKKRRKKK